jgi:hypothetical protein
MKQTIYTSGIGDYVDWLIGQGYEVNTIEEGVLGWGVTVCTKQGYKAVVIREKYINHWSSGHTIRKYNKLPEVYSRALA